MEFTDEQFAILNYEYGFYSYKDKQGKPLKGQYFAIRAQEPTPINGGKEYQFVAAVPILTATPNSPMKYGVLTDTFINDHQAVGGRSPAATVAATHPALIRFLVEQARIAQRV